MVLSESVKLAKNLYAPCFEDMDRHPPELVNGQVNVHKDVKKILSEAGEGGWISATFSKKHDGDQLPGIVKYCLNFVFSMANYPASIYPVLNEGAAGLITSFGSKELINRFVPDMLAGRFQGTMALTEPQAGSSLADITTTAVPDGNGVYKIKGRKTFISAGDHDGVENIIHLMLARIEGSPAGVKGISLFVVPKLREENGKWVPNDIAVSQLYHKMGCKGAPITELAVGDNNNCLGLLLGKENNGLSYMFQMMNEARINVGIGAAGITSAAYYAALEYAKERPQGRKIDAKDPALPQIPIIEHADVKRMLLFQRAIVEGSLSKLLQCSIYADLNSATDGQAQERAELLLEILTPVAKTYPSEMGVLSTSQSIQCFGGYGYCEDFPAEQYYRDVRIHPIHEGTTGIQGMDLLGRKIIMKNGQAFKVYLDEIRQTILTAKESSETALYSGKLENALKTIEKVTLHLISVAQTKGPEAYLADATLYLEMFGIVTVAWQWLKQAIAVEKAFAGKLSKKEIHFYTGKQYTCRYFFSYEVPKIKGLKIRLLDHDTITLDMENAYF